MSNEYKLLPCPFCGCKKPYIDYGTRIAVVCPNCGAWILGGKEPENNKFPPFKNATIEMWNTRAESEVSRYKKELESLNTEFKHLIEKCSMLRDMDWVEQYKVATDMADKALKEIDFKKASQ